MLYFFGAMPLSRDVQIRFWYWLPKGLCVCMCWIWGACSRVSNSLITNVKANSSATRSTSIHLTSWGFEPGSWMWAAATTTPDGHRTFRFKREEFGGISTDRSLISPKRPDRPEIGDRGVGEVPLCSRRLQNSMTRSVVTWRSSACVCTCPCLYLYVYVYVCISVPLCPGVAYLNDAT